MHACVCAQVGVRGPAYKQVSKLPRSAGRVPVLREGPSGRDPRGPARGRPLLCSDRHRRFRFLPHPCRGSAPMCRRGGLLHPELRGGPNRKSPEAEGGQKTFSPGRMLGEGGQRFGNEITQPAGQRPFCARGGVGCPGPLTPGFLLPSSTQRTFSPRAPRAPRAGCRLASLEGFLKAHSSPRVQLLEGRDRGQEGCRGPRGAAGGWGRGDAARHTAARSPLSVCSEGHPRVRGAPGSAFHAALCCTETENRMPTNGSLGKHFYFQLAKEKWLICCSWTGLTSQSAECQALKGGASRWAAGRASPKRVRAAGPETRLTGRGAESLTQDAHCLPCQLPEDLPSPPPLGGPAGGGARAWEARAGAGVPLSGQDRPRTQSGGAGLMIARPRLRLSRSPAEALCPADSEPDSVPWQLMTEQARDGGRSPRLLRAAGAARPPPLPGRHRAAGGGGGLRVGPLLESRAPCPHCQRAFRGCPRKVECPLGSRTPGPAEVA